MKQGRGKKIIRAQRDPSRIRENAMPFVPIPGVVQANVRFLLAGQIIENVMCFRYEGTPFGDAVLAIQTSLESAWWAAIQPWISVAMTNTETYYTDLTDEAGPVSTQPAFPSPAGGNVHEYVPNQVAFCVTHRTANRGRSYRGRTYIAGISGDYVEGNVVVPDALAGIVSGFNALRTDLALNDILFTIASRQHNGAPRVVGIDTAVILSLARDNVVDSQRRRAPGRGR